MAAKQEAAASNTKLALLVVAWYAGNTLYNVYNKKATNMIHAHWFVATAQLVVGIGVSMVMWATGLRKTPNLTAKDIAACIPIGLFASLAHSGSVLASAVGAVSLPRLSRHVSPFLPLLLDF
jgi:solute carrier family 35 protein E1